MTPAKKKASADEPKAETTSADKPRAQTASAPSQQSTTPPNDWNDLRAPIESDFNGQRDAREQKYVTDRVNLENTYHSDLATLQTNKQNALVAAGLNPDGSPPSDYGQTAPPTFDVGGL